MHGTLETDVKSVTGLCQEMSGLTPKQVRFVDKYITCFNASKAALEAGYSPASARSIGPELLQNPKVKDAIAARIREKEPKNEEITTEWLRKTTKSTIEECKNPKDRFIGIELLGKMTPGTFEPVNSAPVQINFLTVLQKLSAPSTNMPQANIPSGMSDAAINIPSGMSTAPLPIPPSAPSSIVAHATMDHSSIDAVSHGGGEVVTPQATRSVDNKDPHKSVEQK